MDETADIPSDSESIDGLCVEDETENDDVECDNEESLHGNHSDSEDSDDDTTADDFNEFTWTENRKTRDDQPFTEAFGPNIPDDATTPQQIFLCLFPHELLDLIVEQTNLYLRKKKLKQIQ